jgi:hypothetical protein
VQELLKDLKAFDSLTADGISQARDPSEKLTYEQCGNSSRNGASLIYPNVNRCVFQGWLNRADHFTVRSHYFAQLAMSYYAELKARAREATEMRNMLLGRPGPSTLPVSRT